MRLVLIAAAVVLAAAPAGAQSHDDGIGVRGFVLFGNTIFQAQDSFDAIFETHSGPVVGGGGQVLLPWGVYVEVAASRFTADGERAFIGPGQEVFRLGIPVDVSIIPLEVTGGWRLRRWTRFVPYGGLGLSSVRYSETSEFATADEDLTERFTGFHLIGGAEVAALRWLALGAEVAWSSVPDALGGGVSAVYGEDNLGGTTVRFKVTVGR